VQGSRERPGRLLRLVPVRDQSAPQASYMHMHIHVHVACDLASAGPAVQAEGALCKAGRATGAEVSQLAVAEVVEDDRRVGATREVVLVHAARYPGEELGVQPGRVALHVSEEMVEDGRVTQLAVVRSVELGQLPAEAPPPRVKLVEVVAGAVELLWWRGDLSQLGA